MIVMYTRDQPEPGRILQVIAYSENPFEQISAKLKAEGVQHILFNGNVSIVTDYVDPDIEIVKPRPRIEVTGVPNNPIKADGTDKVTLIPNIPSHAKVYMAGTLVAEQDVDLDGLEIVTESPGSYVCIFSAPFPYFDATVQVDAVNEA